jgi:hypothetical protein
MRRFLALLLCLVFQVGAIAVDRRRAWALHEGKEGMNLMTMLVRCIVVVLLGGALDFVTPDLAVSQCLSGPRGITPRAGSPASAPSAGGKALAFSVTVTNPSASSIVTQARTASGGCSDSGGVPLAGVGTYLITLNNLVCPCETRFEVDVTARDANGATLCSVKYYFDLRCTSFVTDEGVEADRFSIRSRVPVYRRHAQPLFQ